MLKIFVATEPVYLGGCVSINDITLLILEIPRDNDEDIAFSNPNSFLDFTFDSTKTCHTV